MISHVITATEAGRNLSNILSKVLYRGESFEIKRGREIIAKIIPVKPHTTEMKVNELNDFFQNLPRLEPGDTRAFAETLQEIRTQVGVEKNKWD